MVDRKPGESRNKERDSHNPIDILTKDEICSLRSVKASLCKMIRPEIAAIVEGLGIDQVWDVVVIIVILVVSGAGATRFISSVLACNFFQV